MTMKTCQTNKYHNKMVDEFLVRVQNIKVRMFILRIVFQSRYTL